MYVSFGATGISLSNMMHILSDEEKQQWKSLQAVDYCLWVFCLSKGIILNGLWEEQSFAHVLSFFFFFFFFSFSKFWLDKCVSIELYAHQTACIHDHSCLNSLWLASLL